MPVLNIIFSNKPSEINKKLIGFFEHNLMTLNKSSFIFDFEVANPDRIDEYISKGIKSYPVLIQDNKQLVGVEKIINYLGAQLNIQQKSKQKQIQKKTITKSDDERIDDFWKETIGKVEIDENGVIKEPEDEKDTDEYSELNKKIQKAFNERNESSELKNIKKNSASNPIVRSNHISNQQNKHSPVQGSNNEDETPSQTIKGMSGATTMDDELMAKFFENQEESI